MRTGFTTVPNIAGGAGSARQCAFFHERYVGEEHLLFLHQVNSQLLRERGENLLHLEEFRMILSVHSNYLGGKRQNARALFPNEHVMGAGDMTDQVGE